MHFIVYVQEFGGIRQDGWWGLNEAVFMFFDKDEWWWCGGRRISLWGEEETWLNLLLYVQEFGGNPARWLMGKEEA